LGWIVGDVIHDRFMSPKSRNGITIITPVYVGECQKCGTDIRVERKGLTDRSALGNGSTIRVGFFCPKEGCDGEIYVKRINPIESLK